MWSPPGRRTSRSTDGARRQKLGSSAGGGSTGRCARPVGPGVGSAGRTWWVARGRRSRPAWCRPDQGQLVHRRFRPSDRRDTRRRGQTDAEARYDTRPRRWSISSTRSKTSSNVIDSSSWSMPDRDASCATCTRYCREKKDLSLETVDVRPSHYTRSQRGRRCVSSVWRYSDCRV